MPDPPRELAALQAAIMRDAIASGAIQSAYDAATEFLLDADAGTACYADAIACVRRIVAELRDVVDDRGGESD